MLDVNDLQLYDTCNPYTHAQNSQLNISVTTERPVLSQVLLSLFLPLTERMALLY